MMCHFGTKSFHVVLRGCIDHMIVEDLFVFGRNADERDCALCATVYERSGSEVRPLHELDGGYEPHDLVVSCGCVSGPRVLFRSKCKRWSVFRIQS